MPTLSPWVRRMGIYLDNFLALKHSWDALFWWGRSWWPAPSLSW